MLEIKSQTVKLNTPQKEIFDYLTDLNNYNQLLPEKNISDFSSTSDSCQFKVQNIYTIGMVKKELINNQEIHISSADNSPIKFNLVIYISSDAATNVYLDCKAEVTGMVKMMVEKPLKNLFVNMAERLEEVKG